LCTALAQPGGAHSIRIDAVVDVAGQPCSDHSPSLSSLFFRNTGIRSPTASLSHSGPSCVSYAVSGTMGLPLARRNILRVLMKTGYLGLTALAAAALLLIGCNQNIPASAPPAKDTTTVVPVPVPAEPGPPGPPGPQGPQGPQGPEGPPPAEK
jgi:hypothetical protein